jgi:hypothetical protein
MLPQARFGTQAGELLIEQGMDKQFPAVQDHLPVIKFRLSKESLVFPVREYRKRMHCAQLSLRGR